MHDVAPQGSWQPLEDEFGCAEEDFQERHYREFISFLPHARHFLYGDVSGETKPKPGDIPMQVYRRSDIKRVRITLEEGDEPVVCEVAHTDLYFFYEVDTIILACEISVDDVPLSIAESLMYRFGRAYPAGWDGKGLPIHCPVLVEWLDAAGGVLETSDYCDRERYLKFVGRHRASCIARHWEYVLAPIVNAATGEEAPLRFREIEYFRMPVMAYLTLDDLKVLTKKDYVSLAMAMGVPSQNGLPFSDRFMKRFEAEHVYERLYSGGIDVPQFDTRFLTSGEAFTIVAAGRSLSLNDNERGLLGQFRHQYFLLFLVAHFHKAALMMISDKLVATLRKLDPRELDPLNFFGMKPISFRRSFYDSRSATCSMKCQGAFICATCFA